MATSKNHKKSAKNTTVQLDLSPPEDPKRKKLTGYGNLIDDMRRRKTQIEMLIQEQELDKEKLILEAMKLKADAEMSGEVVKIVEVKTSTDVSHPALVIIKDAYTGIPTDKENALRAMFGNELYKKLFTKQTDVKPKKNIYDKLKKMTGDKFSEFFEVKQSITPRKNFSQLLASTRPTLNAEVNDALDQIIEFSQHKPQVKLW